ncbi:hypothetical protein [Enterocloster lavalensis]|uniref:hypothetical protein n=1 Tax=Enterocloster lavalensis TaxID=460384 RepID=UPI0034A21F23
MKYVIKTNKTKFYQLAKEYSGLELPPMRSFELKKIGHSYWLSSYRYTFYLSGVCGTPLLRIREYISDEVPERDHVVYVSVKYLLESGMLEEVS